MSDKQGGYRLAKPLFVADVPKPGGGTKGALNDNDKKFANVAKKALEPFYSHKYNMYHDYSRGAPTLLDLLHFHVNGEYRLTIDQSLTPPAGLRFTTTRYHDAPRTESPLGALEIGEGFDYTPQMTGLHGLRQRNGDLDVGTSDFFNRLINRNDPGSLFFLPSIGTAIMSMSAYTTAWPTSIRRYFVGNQNNQSGGRIPELFDKLVNNVNEDDNSKLRIGNRDLGRAPWFEVGDINQFTEVIIIAYTSNPLTPLNDNDYPPLPQQANLFFLSWAQAIINAPEIMELTNNIPDTLNVIRNICQCAVRATFCTRKNGLTEDESTNMSFDTPADFELPTNYTEPSDMNIYGATDEFFRFMKETSEVLKAVVDPWRGRYVTLNRDTEWYDDLFMQHRLPFGSKTPFDIDNDEIMEWLPFPDVTDDDDNVSWEPNGEWLVDRPDGNTGRYFLRQSGHELLFPPDGNHTNSIPDGLGDEITYELPFSVRPTVNEHGDTIDLFLQDEDEDEEEGEVSLTTDGFNTALAIATRIVLDRYFEMEAHLTLVLNSTKITFNRFSKEFNDGNSPSNNNLTPNNEFHTSGGKNKTKVADFLAEQRATIMSGIYASYIALTKDVGFKKLFESDLKELEVQWYTNTIAERLLAAVREDTQESALAQLRAEPVPGTANAIQLVGARTILRRLDVPTLRLIMSEYFQSFYQEVGRLAERLDQAPKKKKKKKGKKQLLVDKMWDTVEATVVAVMSLEGVRPHAIWSEVFREVENARRGSDNTSRAIVPPSWAGTVFREQLTRDPKLIGQTPNIERNATLFRNYVGFLRASFAKDYALIANLLTAIQTVSIRQIIDIDELRRFFEERLRSDEKYKVKDQTVGAYRRFIYICRGILTMPAYDFALSMADDRDDLMRERGPELQDALLVQGEQAVAASPPEPIPYHPFRGDVDEGMRANPSLLRPDGGV